MTRRPAKRAQDQRTRSTTKGKRGRRQLDASLDQRLGALIRTRRAELGWSQQVLGQKLNLTFQQVQKYENGSNQLSVARLLQLCDVLDVGVSYFLGSQSNTVSATSLDYKLVRAIAQTDNQRLKLAALRLIAAASRPR
jgi:transcriptional regulator with XRE-family HTH domain